MIPTENQAESHESGPADTVTPDMVYSFEPDHIETTTSEPEYDDLRTQTPLSRYANSNSMEAQTSFAISKQHILRDKNIEEEESEEEEGYMDIPEQYSEVYEQEPYRSSSKESTPPALLDPDENALSRLSGPLRMEIEPVQVIQPLLSMEASNELLYQYREIIQSGAYPMFLMSRLLGICQ
jgi:hypothetical protein